MAIVDSREKCIATDMHGVGNFEKGDILRDICKHQNNCMLSSLQKSQHQYWPQHLLEPILGVRKQISRCL